MQDWFMTYWPVVNFIIVVLGAWAMWSMARKFVSHDHFIEWQENHSTEHAALDDRLEEGETRFTRIETTMQNLPTRGDLDAIVQSLTRLTADVSAFSAKVDAMQDTLTGLQSSVRLVLEHELAEGRDAKRNKG